MQSAYYTDVVHFNRVYLRQPSIVLRLYPKNARFVGNDGERLVRCRIVGSYGLDEYGDGNEFELQKTIVRERRKDVLISISKYCIQRYLDYITPQYRVCVLCQFTNDRHDGSGFMEESIIVIKLLAVIDFKVRRTECTVYNLYQTVSSQLAMIVDCESMLEMFEDVYDVDVTSSDYSDLVDPMLKRVSHGPYQALVMLFKRTAQKLRLLCNLTRYVTFGIVMFGWRTMALVRASSIGLDSMLEVISGEMATEPLCLSDMGEAYVRHLSKYDIGLLYPITKILGSPFPNYYSILMAQQQIADAHRFDVVKTLDRTQTHTYYFTLVAELKRLTDCTTIKLVDVVHMNVQLQQIVKLCRRCLFVCPNKALVRYFKLICFPHSAITFSKFAYGDLTIPKENGGNGVSDFRCVVLWAHMFGITNYINMLQKMEEIGGEITFVGSVVSYHPITAIPFTRVMTTDHYSVGNVFHNLHSLGTTNNKPEVRTLYYDKVNTLPKKSPYFICELVKKYSHELITLDEFVDSINKRLFSISKGSKGGTGSDIPVFFFGPGSTNARKRSIDDHVSSSFAKHVYSPGDLFIPVANHAIHQIDPDRQLYRFCTCILNQGSCVHELYYSLYEIDNREYYFKNSYESDPRKMKTEQKTYKPEYFDSRCLYINDSTFGKDTVYTLTTHKNHVYNIPLDHNTTHPASCKQYTGPPLPATCLCIEGSIVDIISLGHVASITTEIVMIRSDTATSVSDVIFRMADQLPGTKFL